MKMTTLLPEALPRALVQASGCGLQVANQRLHSAEVKITRAVTNMTNTGNQSDTKLANENSLHRLERPFLPGPVFRHRRKEKVF